MSLVKITKDLIENVTLSTRPRVIYSSSSMGATGSIPLVSRPSKVNKTKTDSTVFTDTTYSSQKNIIDEFLDATVNLSKGVGKTDITGAMETYMDLVHSQSQINKNSKSFAINRFEPPFTFKTNTTIKNITKNILMPYYREKYNSSEFSYKNYHCLNFFTASSVPSNSALIYPNFTSSYASAPYTLESGFTFDFYINPRYTNESDIVPFKAGTIFHLSSSYAISLVTGSKKDDFGTADGFRILLQLSHSADIAPSQVNLEIKNNQRSYPEDLIFLSDDNSLDRNSWHHVSIRWGTNSYNNGTGSIAVDSNISEFSIPSGSIDPVSSFSDDVNPPEALFIGNYYNGANYDGNAIKSFFNTSVSSKEGLQPALGFTQDPESFSFDHPLNAEVHDLKIYGMYVPDDHILDRKQSGPSSLNMFDMRMYVPPFFSRETRTREVPLTPFQTATSYTDDPYNVAMSFGVGGHLINLENHVKDYVQKSFPRLYSLTASTIDGTVSEGQLANTFLYATASIRKRNLTVLPCDNGFFNPNHSILFSGSIDDTITATHPMRPFRNSLGNTDLSIIDLSDLIPTGSLFDGLIQQSGSIMDEILGSSPTNPGVAPGSVLTIFQRMRDGSSNEISFFDISNLYYGNKINPTSFKIWDQNISGSDGKVKITLKDDGRGALYRADSNTKHAESNFIGNIFYDEGIVLVKTPCIPFFGKDQHNIEFLGQNNIHINTINVPAASGLVNSSSNPGYIQNLTASASPNDESEGFVYVTGVNFHDENLNVVMRASLSQPAVKRFEDEFLFKIKMDY
jgi:hypothetical protein